jgi:fumarate reductase subunit D
MATRSPSNGSAGRPTLKTDQPRPPRPRPGGDAPWWGLFAAGGTLAALFLPVQMLVDGVLGSAGVSTASSDYRRMRRVVSNPLVRLFLLANISLPLFQAVHRFRMILFDLGVHQPRTPIAVAAYGSGILATLAAAWALLRVPGNGRR